jgi:hypothetical protein
MSGPRWGDGTDDEPLGKALRNWRTAIGVAGSLLSLFVSVFELSLTFGGRGGCGGRRAIFRTLCFGASVVIFANT